MNLLSQKDLTLKETTSSFFIRTCLELMIFSTTEVPMLVAAPTEEVAKPAENKIRF